MKRLIHILPFFLLLAGCVRQADWPMPDQPPDLVVVDATLTDQRKTQSIRLTRVMNSLNETPQPVTDATVVVSNADTSWTLKADTGNQGYYLTDSLFAARLNNTYTLQIIRGDQTFSALASMVPGKVFNELIYKKNPDNGWYYIDWVASAFSADNPAMWEVLIDWSAVPGFETQDPDSCLARLLFYTLPTIDVSEIFAPIMEQTFFPAGSLITERRYSLASGHAEFLRELLLETNWQGSMFPTANANVSTNLSAGAVGYFGVCAVTELSLVVE
ncbi:MAG: DUF4249 family protein [bacterium]